MTATLMQRSRARQWLDGSLIALATVVSGWLFAAFLQASIALFIGRDADARGWEILDAGVFGYLFASLVIRLVRRDFALPAARILLINALVGFGRGWLIGIVALGAKSLLVVIRSGTGPPSGSWVADAVFFLLTLLVLALPGLVGLALANSLRPQRRG